MGGVVILSMRGSDLSLFMGCCFFCVNAHNNKQF